MPLALNSLAFTASLTRLKTELFMSHICIAYVLEYLWACFLHFQKNCLFIGYLLSIGQVNSCNEHMEINSAVPTVFVKYDIREKMVNISEGPSHTSLQ